MVGFEEPNYVYLTFRLAMIKESDILGFSLVECTTERIQ